MRSRPAALRVSILLVSLLLSAATAFAQFEKIDELASQLTKELKPRKPHLVAVVDFRPPYGATMPQGHYFAWILSSYLDQHAKNKFVIANHIDFDKDLASRNIPSSTLVPGEALQSAAPHLGADVLLTGTIEQHDNSYVLQVTPINVRDGKPLSTLSQSIKMTDFMESFVTPFPPNILDASGRGGSPSIAMPSCIRCPDPSYNDLARKKKVNGSCILNVLISESGQPRQIRPMKLLGYGLDERAFDIIKTWKFRPATLKRDGTPVAVIVAVEVTFRIY